MARKGYLGHITTDGVATEVPIDPNASMDGFTIGSDGAIWYIIFPDQTGAFGRIERECEEVLDQRKRPDIRHRGCARRALAV